MSAPAPAPRLHITRTPTLTEQLAQKLAGAAAPVLPAASIEAGGDAGLDAQQQLRKRFLAFLADELLPDDAGESRLSRDGLGWAGEKLVAYVQDLDADAARRRDCDVRTVLRELFDIMHATSRDYDAFVDAGVEAAHTAARSYREIHEEAYEERRLELDYDEARAYDLAKIAAERLNSCLGLKQRRQQSWRESYVMAKRVGMATCDESHLVQAFRVGLNAFLLYAQHLQDLQTAHWQLKRALAEWEQAQQRIARAEQEEEDEARVTHREARQSAPHGAGRSSSSAGAHQVNPATGLPIVAGDLDALGNAYGLDDSWDTPQALAGPAHGGMEWGMNDAGFDTGGVLGTDW